ncbi:hypothetical protein [Candidatus Pelagibacter sp. HIMB123]|uniref:hypothetical protein n=1 Tax=Candidatus Pelagibacter sp. HIMB123 TaxID=3415413 RepID=UPI003F87689B
MKKNLILLASSILIIIFLLEFYLKFFGKYQNLTKHNLSPSEAIYERSHSSNHNYKHPDINYIIQNYYDVDGVKNFEKTPTSSKKKIVGMFGDSFTENIGVDKEFEYSNILNQNIENYNIVNYGVGGYSADQVFIRYLKYKHHDIKYLFYLLMPGDDGFSTKSKFYSDGKYIIDQPKLSLFFQAIGKLNITYFLVDSYYFLKSILSDNYSSTETGNYNSILSNKIYEQFYHQDLKKCKHLQKKIEYKDFVDCKLGLFNLLKIFQSETENNNIEFYVLVYPDPNFVNFFEEVLKLEKNNISYFVLDSELVNNKKFIFKNPFDKHWNEYGNIVYAKNLQNIFSKLGLDSKKIDINKFFKKVDTFYANQN